MLARRLLFLVNYDARVLRSRTIYGLFFSFVVSKSSDLANETEPALNHLNILNIHTQSFNYFKFITAHKFFKVKLLIDARKALW